MLKNNKNITITVVIIGLIQGFLYYAGLGYIPNFIIGWITWYILIKGESDYSQTNNFLSGVFVAFLITMVSTFIGVVLVDTIMINIY